MIRLRSRRSGKLVAQPRVVVLASMGCSDACAARMVPRRTFEARSSIETALSFSSCRERFRVTFASTSPGVISRRLPRGRQPAISARSAPSDVTMKLGFVRLVEEHTLVARR